MSCRRRASMPTGLHALLIRLKQAAAQRSRLACRQHALSRRRCSAASRGLPISRQGAFVPLIAVNDVLYHAPERRALAGCRHLHPRAPDAGSGGPAAGSQCRTASQAAGRKWRGCSARAPRPWPKRRVFSKRCNFSLEELRGTEYADETRQGYATPQEALVAFAEEGLKRRFPDGAPAKVRHALDEELRLIGELELCAVFPDRRRDREIRARPGTSDPVPGPRLGGELGDLLLPRHHRRVAR